jgi:hypothetical protein
MGRTPIQEIPEYLQATYRMLECGFPDGVEFDDADYFPLLSALLEGLNFRNAGLLISLFTDREYSMAYHDTLVVDSPTTDIPSPEDVARIRERLVPCGYEAWVKENECSMGSSLKHENQKRLARTHRPREAFSV